jgi:hypothetical protein
MNLSALEKRMHPVYGGDAQEKRFQYSSGLLILKDEILTLD